MNLQIDNAWFWRSNDDAQLDCGLLDWYGTRRAPIVAHWMGCLSGVEPQVLKDHEDGLMKAFSEEYYRLVAHMSARSSLSNPPTHAHTARHDIIDTTLITQVWWPVGRSK